MTTPVPDFIPGEVLTAAKLDQLGAAVNDNVTSIATANQQVTLLTGEVDGLMTGSAASAAQAQALAGQVAAQAATIQQLTAANTTLQTTQTSLLNRVTVLEKATPPPAVPQAPTALHSTAITTTTIAMAMTAPGAGPAPDTYQWAYATPQGSGAWVNGPSTAGTTTTLTGLTPGTPYDVRATSVSTANGPGGVSATYPVSTGTAPPVVTVPQAATGLSAAATTGTLAVSAIPPSQGSPATSWHWEYRTPAGSGAYTSGPTNAGIATTITGLTPATAYGVRVTGINSAGAGAASAEFVTATATGTAVSVDGTTIPPAAQIIMTDTTVVTLAGGQVVFTAGGVTTPDPLTANVVLIGVFNGGVLYQKNNVGGWWYLDRTQGYPWVETTDPTVSVTPPPPVSNPNVTVNLSALTGKTMNKNIWGFASGMDLHDGCTQFLSNGNPFMATAAKLRPTYLRFNANEDPLRRYGQGQTTIFDLLFSNLSQWADPAIRFCLGVGPTSSGDTGVSATQWGTWTTSLLTHFQAIGQLSKFDLEVGNETNDIDMAYYGAVYNAISDAAFAVSPSVLVGGTCADWWGHMSVSTWLSTSAAKIARNGFFSFHSYRTNPTTADADLYAIALGFGDVAAIRGSLAGSAAAHVGVRNNEYGIDGDFTNPDQREAKIQGAIYDDILLTHCFQTDESAVGFSGGGRWDLVQDGYYGAIGNQLFGVNMATITPQGWHKGISGQLMRGTEVVVSTTLPNVQVVAVKNAAGMALKLTNYGFVNQSATVGVSGGALGNVSMKQLTQATSNTAGPPSVALASLTGVVLPAQSITWITG